MNNIDFSSDKLCFHVIDCIDPLDDSSEILNRLKSILEKWLLTANEQWRQKNWFEVTSASRTDVFSTKFKSSMWEKPKEYLQNIVKSVWTTVWLLLEAEHDEYWKYPYSLIKEWIKPEIKAIVVDESSPLFFDLYNELLNISSSYWVLLLNSLLNQLEKPVCIIA